MDKDIPYQPKSAGIILIGDELLSGRTRDGHLQTLAKFLCPLGVQICEARIIADNKETIIHTVREFSKIFDYVFTTGGIGPTHDDITADCIAEAFELGISERDDALTILRTRYNEDELNPARRRMARIPDGADLIKNPVSQAPGFQTRNVFTLAGVPSIMKAMLDDIPHRIEGGTNLLSVTIKAPNIGEGDAAAPLAELERIHTDVSIGSYPYFNDDLRGVNFVARSHNPDSLAAAELAIHSLVKTLMSDHASTG